MIVILPVLALLGAIVMVTIRDLLRPTVRRMAVRNMVRRPTEALLVVAGASLGTAIITSSFVVGDTFDATIRDFGRTELGPIDEQVLVDDVDRLDEVEAAAVAEPLPGSDGALPLITTTAAVAGGASGITRAEPRVTLAEVDFDTARGFGGDVAATGLADAGPTPQGDEVVINDFLADELGVAAGDTVDLHAYGQPRTLTVRTVVPRLGLAGYADLYVEPGTIDALASGAARQNGAAPPIGELLVSNEGGVYDGATRTAEVTARLEDRLASLEDADGSGRLEVATLKQDVLDDAEESATGISQMFTTFGAFSVLVGVLLLVNLFVMLAEERRSELGMLRAVGMKRMHLVRLFGAEGGLYSLLAAVVGTAAGVGVGLGIVQATKSILAAEDDLTFVFSVDPASLIIGGLIGLAISLLTVWGTSARIARINVIRAIRDLPEPRVRATSLRRLLLAAVGVLAGLFAFQTGLAGDQAVAVLVGPALALFSAVPLLGRLLPHRGVVAAAGLVTGAWAIVAETAVPNAFDGTGFEMFVVKGVLLVAAAVAVISQADRVWAWTADRLADRGGLAVRLAVAYPLARRVRTGILLAMFSLVIFTLTLMSAFSEANLQQAPELADEASAGWDLWVDSSPTNPLSAGELAAAPGVAQSAGMVRGGAELSAPTVEADAELWPVTGFDESLLTRGVPELSERTETYGDDRAAFEAVLADSSLAIAPEWLFQNDGPPGDAVVEVGDRITATDPASGAERQFTLVGMVESDWLDNGLLVGRDAAADLLTGRGIESRHYVAVDDGTDPDRVADGLTATFIDRGADAATFESAVEQEMRELRGFVSLLQGYLGLGLIIGIAGLGVVMVRAVRQRRRQIGMLRAIGFPARVVRRAFLAEAGFVAVQGVVLGIGLGLVTAYQMITGEAFGEPLPFVVPWIALVVLLVVPAGAALAAAVAPAAQAARIRPAAALRSTE